MKSQLDQLIEQTEASVSARGPIGKKKDVTPLDAALLTMVAGGLSESCNMNIQCWYHPGNTYWQDL